MDGFIIIGNKNAVAIKQMFPFIKDGKVRIGYNHPYFKGLEGLTRWYVTYPVTEKPPLTLTATYSHEKYPKYDNYDAIEVSRVKDIPKDYDGVMGVPIGILDYDLENVEVLQLCASHSKTPRGIENENCYLDGEWKYPRILIRRKNYE